MASVDVEKADKIEDEELAELEQIEDEDDAGLEQWTSRWSFILASIGSAVGLGNFWRFPFLAYRWGGGAFFIPYFLALFLVGIPLIQLEMAIGQVFRRAAVQAFGKLSERARGVGLAAAFISFGIVGYYAAILGWGNVMFVKSFYSELPWSIRGVNGSDVLSIPSNHFFNDVLHVAAPNAPSVIPAAVFAGAMFQWVCVWLILIKGQDFISKAVWVTVLLPVVMLFILLGVGVSLEGSEIGIKAYIGQWDMDLLSNGDMWVDAFGQIFFSLSLSTGVMSAYASFNPRNSDIVKDAIIVAISNSAFSFVAGFAVFSIAGYFSAQSGIPLENLRLAGPSLAFITYPAGLSLLDGAAANVMCVLFFLTFFFLGVDSAFSLVEAVVHNIRETAMFAKYTRAEVTTMVCIFTAMTTWVYVLDIGINVLDVMDFYISSSGLLVVGFAESFIAGWVYNKSKTAERVGWNAVIIFDTFFVAGGFGLFSVLSLSLPYADVSKNASIGIAIGALVLCIAVGTVAGVALGASQAGGAKEALYALYLHGPDSLKNTLNKVITHNKPGNWRFTIVWAIMLKFIMTPILFFLLCLRVEGLVAGKGYARSDYPDDIYLQIMGAIALLLVVVLIVFGAVFPNMIQDPRSKPVY